MISPFRGFRDMQSEMNRMIAEAFGRLPRMTSPAQTAESGWIPAVDVVTKDGDMVVKVALPEMKRDDVDVSFQGGVLTISGERKQEEEHKDVDYLVKECTYGSFRRSMTLPEGVDEGKIKGNFSDCLLEVTVEGAATQVEEGPRKIEIEG
jgi:HSP20 family protein